MCSALVQVPSSQKRLKSLVDGSAESVPKTSSSFVHVYDVAQAHVEVYERESEGRFDMRPQI